MTEMMYPISFDSSDDLLGRFHHPVRMNNYTEQSTTLDFRALEIPSRQISRNPLATLSNREIDVVQELVDGRSTDAAADRLFISRHTFRTHLKNISRKLNTHSSLETVSLAVEHGMRPSRLMA